MSWGAYYPVQDTIGAAYPVPCPGTTKTPWAGKKRGQRSFKFHTDWNFCFLNIFWCDFSSPSQHIFVASPVFDVLCVSLFWVSFVFFLIPVLPLWVQSAVLLQSMCFWGRSTAAVGSGLAGGPLQNVLDPHAAGKAGEKTSWKILWALITTK